LAAGLASRPGGTFVALTVSGRMTGFNTVDGTETWSLQLSGLLAPANALPATSAESLAAIVHADGRVTAVDLGLRAKVWELAVNEAMSEASHAVVGSDGVYVITRQGTVCKYPRAPASGAPAALWRKPLDGGTETPLAAGKYVYAVSTFGTIYALSLADGAERWKYRIAGTPTGMSEHNGLLYVGTKEGHVLILKTE
jgi:outer membrane protein assembly factor BamB